MTYHFDISKIDEQFHSGIKEKRDCYEQVYHYLIDDGYQSKVCALYGLRRTGKTILMRQCAENLPEEMKNKALFITCNKQTDIYDVIAFLKNAIGEGYKYFFIDEVTYAENFQKVGEVLSDIFVGINGARIVLTGTASLGLSLPSRANMYDRILFVPTTYTSFAEYSRLTGCNSIDDYIQFGSTLKTDVFASYEKMEKYIETSIVDNIIHSLEKSEGIEVYPATLTELYEKDVLKNAIQRIINTYSQDATVKALRKQFSASPLSSALEVITKHSDLTIAQVVDQKSVNDSVAKILGIIPYNIKEFKMEQSHYEAIQQFLKDIDVFTTVPVLHSYADEEFTRDMEMITHPGMFHANIKYVLEELAKDKSWMPGATAEQRNKVIRESYNWAAGRIMENFIIADVYHMLCGFQEVKKEDLFGIESGRWYVSKLQHEVEGRKLEADIVIFDKKTKDTYLFEIKHSSEFALDQSKHLEDEAFLKYVTEHFGPIKGRAVLYNGDTLEEPEIPRISARDFLLQMYRDVKEKDFTPEKTLKELSSRNLVENKKTENGIYIDDAIQRANDVLNQNKSQTNLKRNDEHTR